MIHADTIFFEQYRDRQVRIRPPVTGEFADEFRGLGPHKADRRRILAWKVPPGSALGGGMILCVPFLAFADEAIRDDDATLLPILDELMRDAGIQYGMTAPGTANANRPGVAAWT